MTSKRRANRDARRIRRAAVATGKTGVRSAALAIAAGQVIARRTALGLAAVGDPGRAEHKEFNRIIPEKLRAARIGAMGIAVRSGEVVRQSVRYSGTEAVMFTNALGILARCRTPAAIAAVHTQSAMAWFFRSFSHAIAVNEICMRAWGDIVAPLHQVAVGNAQRLRLTSVGEK